MNIASLRINSVIVHSVPRAGDESEHLTLTDAPIELDDDLRSYFEGKVRDSLTQGGLQVVADEAASPIVRTGVQEVLKDTGALVASSRVFAEHLNAVQNGRNPAGLLVVSTGELDEDGSVVVVLKLERQRGVHFTIEEREGHNVVDLEFLRRLTLTDKTRIFKTAVLAAVDHADAMSLYGVASDDQRGRDEVGIADFFLSTFLGCRLRTNPAKATSDFVSAAHDFINEDVPSAERKARYLVSMQGRLDDNVLDINPRTFAETQLLSQDRPAFLQRVHDHGLDLDSSFQKDTSLVKTAKFRVVFQHGMVLLATRDDLNSDRLAINDSVSEPTAEIRDAISRLDGR